MTNQRPQDTIARKFSPLARMLVVLLCALYIVAPLWHVCEMSGSHCEHEAQSSTRLLSCTSSHAEDRHSEAHHDEVHEHADELCPCPDHEGKQRVSVAEVSARDAGFNGTCLAMLLTTMPGHVAATFGFVPIFSQRTLPANFPFVVRPVAALPQPPARGPPCLV